MRILLLFAAVFGLLNGAEAAKGRPGLMKAVYVDPMTTTNAAGNRVQHCWCSDAELKYLEVGNGGTGWSYTTEDPNTTLTQGLRQEKNDIAASGRYSPMLVGYQGCLWNRTKADMTLRIAATFRHRIALGFDLTRSGTYTWAWTYGNKTPICDAAWAETNVNFCTVTLKPGATPMKILALGNSWLEVSRPPAAHLDNGWSALSSCSDPAKVASRTTDPSDFRPFSDDGTGSFFSVDENDPQARHGFCIIIGSSAVPLLKSFYTLVFAEANGMSLWTQTGIPSGAKAAVPLLVENERQVLGGWTVNGSDYSLEDFASLEVTGDMTATALMTNRTYAVTFVDSDGVTVLKRAQAVAHGANAVPPVPTKTGFDFIKWDRAYTNVTSDLRVKAVWRDASKPTGYKDVTTYSYSGFLGIGKFSPLVPNDKSKASANASNLSAMISRIGDGGILYFPKGNYYIDGKVTVSTAGITLWGEKGAVFVRTGVTNTNSTPYPDNAAGGDYNWASFLMIQAPRTTVRGIDFKYEVPTCFTGVITSVGSGGDVIVKLTDGRSSLFTGNERFQRINTFDASGRPLGYDLVLGAGTTAGTHYKQPSNVTTDADGVKSFKLWLSPSLKVGDYLGMCCSTAYCQGFVVYPSSVALDDIVFEDVTISNCFSMIMVANGVRNLTLKRFRVEDDTPGSLYTSGMDGIHIAAMDGALKLEECEFRGLADDMLNVHCTAGVVAAVTNSTVYLKSPVEATVFVKGDTVKFYTARLGDLGTATVSSAKTSNGQVTSFTVDALPAGVVADCLIGDQDRMPTVDIAGCRFGVTRARGILLQTDAKILVKNCEFHDTRLAGILLSPSATGTWREMGPIRDATVSNCTFTACGVGNESSSGVNNAAVVIRCNHDSDSGWAYEKNANRNITLSNNAFRDCVSAGVFASNTSNLVVRANAFENCGGRVANYDNALVRVEYCLDTIVKDNVSSGAGFTNACTNGGSSSRITATDNELWYDVLYRDADGTVLARGRTKLGCTAERPSWSDALTVQNGTFSGWAKTGTTEAYDFTAPITGPVDLTATYK